LWITSNWAGSTETVYSSFCALSQMFLFPTGFVGNQMFTFSEDSLQRRFLRHFLSCIFFSSTLHLSTHLDENCQKDEEHDEENWRTLLSIFSLARPRVQSCFLSY
jgi:hypothetical protein